MAVHVLLQIGVLMDAHATKMKGALGRMLDDSMENILLKVGREYRKSELHLDKLIRGEDDLWKKKKDETLFTGENNEDAQEVPPNPLNEMKKTKKKKMKKSSRQQQRREDPLQRLANLDADGSLLTIVERALADVPAQGSPVDRDRTLCDAIREATGYDPGSLDQIYGPPMDNNSHVAVIFVLQCPRLQIHTKDTDSGFLLCAAMKHLVRWNSLC